MRLRLLGSTSEAGACPTLYETDRGTIVVQGLQLTDPEALADLREVLDGESAVEVPRELLTDMPDECSDERIACPRGAGKRVPTGAAGSRPHSAPHSCHDCASGPGMIGECGSSLFPRDVLSAGAHRPRRPAPAVT
jgi:hypothetical protein